MHACTTAPASSDRVYRQSFRDVAVTSTHLNGRTRVLPDALRDLLAAFGGRQLGSACAVHLTDLPLNEVPVTPDHPSRGAEAGGGVADGAAWLHAIGATLGHVVGYRQEQNGATVQHLLPVAADATAQTSTSSAVTLAWHTETAFHPHRPTWLALLALRGAAGAYTLLADVRDIMAALHPDDVAQLRLARYTTGVDRSFGVSTRRSAPQPILSGTPANPHFWFDGDLMRGEDPSSHAAFLRLCQHIDRVAVRVELQTGDCLIVDNTLAAHGRSPFTARFDGSDRWLQRALILDDLSASAHERDGVVITTSFD